MSTTDHRLRLLAILWYLLVSMLYVLTVEAQIRCSDRNIGPVTDVGNSVLLTALCYPNGSAVFVWSAQDDSVRRIQIEYECYKSSNATEPNPQVVIAWTHIRDGSYVTEDIWDENKTCTFYGCYETEIGFLFDKRWIPNTNCTATFQPTITAGPVDTVTEYPHNVSLSCTARGIPVPEFTWTVDFGSGLVDVMESGQMDIITVPTGIPNEYTSILTPMSVGPSTATYTCHVSNPLGSDSSAAMLNVQVLVPPGVEDMIVNEGDTLSITCESSGLTRITSTRWTGPNGGDISDRRTLTVPDIQRSQSGVYTCFITNRVGNTISGNGTVIVQYAPDVDTPISSPHLSPVGQPLTLSCSYDALPTPTVIWLRDVMVLNPSDGRISVTLDTSSRSSVLTVMDLRDDEGGIYVCLFTNVVGSNVANIEVTVQGDSQLVLPIAVGGGVGSLVLGIVIITITIIVIVRLRKKKLASYFNDDHFYDVIPYDNPASYYGLRKNPAYDLATAASTRTQNLTGLHTGDQPPELASDESRTKKATELELLPMETPNHEHSQTDHTDTPLHNHLDTIKPIQAREGGPATDASSQRNSSDEAETETGDASDQHSYVNTSSTCPGDGIERNKMNGISEHDPTGSVSYYNKHFDSYEQCGDKYEQLRSYEQASDQYDRMQNHERRGDVYEEAQQYETHGGGYDCVQQYEKPCEGYDRVQQYELITRSSPANINSV